MRTPRWPTRLAATVVVGSTALRLAALEPGLAVDDLVARLRRARPLHPALSDPGLYPPLVRRFEAWLPPHRRLGSCVKRSLLLLALWSRCGLEPVFHYGVARSADGTLRSHAWLSDVPAELLGGDGSEGFVEAFVLGPGAGRSPI